VTAADGETMRACRSTSTDLELETAALACRAMTYQEGERAKRLENPGARADRGHGEARRSTGEEARGGSPTL
jgi:hypothetical protein